MGDAVELDRVSQRADDVVLADDLVEVQGTMGAVEGRHLGAAYRRAGHHRGTGFSLSPQIATVHPPSKCRTRAVPAALAPARLAHGTRVTLLSAASFRT